MQAEAIWAASTSPFTLVDFQLLFRASDDSASFFADTLADFSNTRILILIKILAYATTSSASSFSSQP
jgi:hypothetical protein